MIAGGESDEPLTLKEKIMAIMVLGVIAAVGIAIYFIFGAAALDLYVSAWLLLILWLVGRNLCTFSGGSTW